MTPRLLVALIAAAVAYAPPTAGAPIVAEEGEAAALMRAVEVRFRALARAVRLDVVTTRPAAEASAGLPEREETSLWGLVGDRGGETSLLFVFAAPRRMRGTGLLLVDRQGGDGDDALWYHMKTFDRFKRIPRSSLKLRVPGTSLTYEDAHGFFATDRYRFGFAPAPAAGDSKVVVEARPRSEELARDLGFASARVTVDRRRLLVTAVDFRRADGRTLRTYRVSAAERVRAATGAPTGELWLARRARVVDVDSGVASLLEYSFWPLPAAPDPALLALRVEDRPLLDRVLGALDAQGIPTAGSTPAAAADRIRAFTTPPAQGGSQ